MLDYFAIHGYLEANMKISGSKWLLTLQTQKSINWWGIEYVLHVMQMLIFPTKIFRGLTLNHINSEAPVFKKLGAWSNITLRLLPGSLYSGSEW